MREVWAAIGIVLAGLLVLLVLEGEPSPERPRRNVPRRSRRSPRGWRRCAACASDSRPVPQTVSPAQARREGLEDLDRSYPEARRKADEEVLKLLGLIEPGVDLRSISASVFGEGVAGYYDPRSKRLQNCLRNDT